MGVGFVRNATKLLQRLGSRGRQGPSVGNGGVKGERGVYPPEAVTIKNRAPRARQTLREGRVSPRATGYKGDTHTVPPDAHLARVRIRGRPGRAISPPTRCRGTPHQADT